MGLLPKERPGGLDSPVTAKIMKYASRANVVVFRLTNGWIGSKWRIGAGWKRPVPMLLLDHVGRASGRRFTTPVLYLTDGDSLVIVGSQGGLPKDPQWIHNLRARPQTTVHLPRMGRRSVLARAAEPAERSRLWPRLVDLYADFDTYQSWTEREIPVVILDPR